MPWTEILVPINLPGNFIESTLEGENTWDIVGRFLYEKTGIIRKDLRQWQVGWLLASNS